MKGTLFGNRVFADVIKLRCGLPELAWAPKCYVWCFYGEKEIWRHIEGRPCEGRGRDWSDAATNQGTFRIEVATRS